MVEAVSLSSPKPAISLPLRGVPGGKEIGRIFFQKFLGQVLALVFWGDSAG